MDNLEAVTIREIRIIKQKPGAHHWENRKVLGACTQMLLTIVSRGVEISSQTGIRTSLYLF